MLDYYLLFEGSIIMPRVCIVITESTFSWGLSPIDSAPVWFPQGAVLDWVNSLKHLLNQMFPINMKSTKSVWEI